MQSIGGNSGHESGVLQMVNDLESLIERDVKIPFMKGHAFFVNVEEVFTLTNKIRVSLPQELKRAERLVENEARILEDSSAQAARIVQEARREADRLVSEANAKAEVIAADEEVRKLAGEKARQILADAEEQARGLRRNADEYARTTLQGLDDQLGKLQSQIIRGRESVGR